MGNNANIISMIFMSVLLIIVVLFLIYLVYLRISFMHNANVLFCEISKYVRRKTEYLEYKMWREREKISNRNDKEAE